MEVAPTQRQNEIVLKRGRPFKIPANSFSFLDLYLDPFKNPQQICNELNISLATFYRYEAELNLPKVKVGLASLSGFTSRLGLNKLYDPVELCDAEILKALARVLKIRFALFADDPIQIVKKIQQGYLEMGIASLAATPTRRKLVDFSYAYLFNTKPHGQLFTAKGPEPLREVGVVRGTVHHEYALKNWQGQYELVECNSFQTLFERIENHSIQGYFAYTKYQKTHHTQYQTCGSQITLPGHTAIAIQSGQEDLRQTINWGLEILHEKNILQEIEEKYLGG